MIVACIKCGAVTILPAGENFKLCKNCGNTIRRFVK